MNDLETQTKQLNCVYQVRSLRGERKRANVQALAGVDMEIKRGELFGLLGPNGAGKTTLIKIMTTLHIEQMNLPVFFASLVLGILSLAFLGLFLGALTLLMTRESWEIGEGVAGALYVFSGAIFPLSVLPDWLCPIGLGLPITYWLELIRRSLLGPTAAAFPTFAQRSDLSLLVILAGMTSLYSILAVIFFRWAGNRARQQGLLDVQTQF